MSENFQRTGQSVCVTTSFIINTDVTIYTREDTYVIEVGITRYHKAAGGNRREKNAANVPVTKEKSRIK